MRHRRSVMSPDGRRPLRGRQGDNAILESQRWSEPEVTRHPERGSARKDRLASISTVATDPSVVHEPTEAESMALRKVMEIHDSHFPANGYVRYVPYLSNSIMDSAIVKRRASKEGTSAAPSRREATPNVLYGGAPLAFFRYASQTAQSRKPAAASSSPLVSLTRCCILGYL
ncbi:hypothetical protein FOZ62_007920 [Perkinsus olseni]|uniref:Uncharacterized protein n=1 Tax=Perkinsus olseni TaxID=32597 RepID=A0A7J6SY10_PEROL|nr:hypothetical protein FOZ62_007920 [Perkinsus olseni]